METKFHWFLNFKTVFLIKIWKILLPQDHTSPLRINTTVWREPQHTCTGSFFRPTRCGMDSLSVPPWPNCPFCPHPKVYKRELLNAMATLTIPQFCFKNSDSYSFEKFYFNLIVSIDVIINSNKIWLESVTTLCCTFSDPYLTTTFDKIWFYTVP